MTFKNLMRLCGEIPTMDFIIAFGRYDSEKLAVTRDDGICITYKYHNGNLDYVERNDSNYFGEILERLADQFTYKSFMLSLNNLESIFIDEDDLEEFPLQKLLALLDTHDASYAIRYPNSTKKKDTQVVAWINQETYVLSYNGEVLEEYEMADSFGEEVARLIRSSSDFYNIGFYNI